MGLLQFGLDVVNISFLFAIVLQLRANEFQMPKLQQALFVGGKAKRPHSPTLEKVCVGLSSDSSLIMLTQLHFNKPTLLNCISLDSPTLTFIEKYPDRQSFRLTTNGGILDTYFRDLDTLYPDNF